MKALANIILILLCVSCSSLKVPISKGCIENEKFKENFFLSINRVEKYMLGTGDKKSFQTSLKFIANYNHVSYDKMLNYNNSYPSYEDYEKDKSEWLIWYEKNKCSNIKSL